MRGLLAFIALALAAHAQTTCVGCAGSGNRSATPGGTSGAVQFNNGGSLGGNDLLLWNGNALSIDSNVLRTATPAPSAPVVATHGASGTTTYGYKITFQTPTGESLPSPETLIHTGNATLDGANYNIITVPPCPFADMQVNIYVTTPSQGWAAFAPCGGSYTDQSGSGYGTFPPASDYSQGIHSPSLAAIYGTFGNWNGLGSTPNSVMLNFNLASSILSTNYLSTSPNDATSAFSMNAEAYLSDDSNFYQPMNMNTTLAGTANYATAIGASVGTTMLSSGTVTTMEALVVDTTIFSGHANNSIVLVVHDGIQYAPAGSVTNQYGVVIDNQNQGGAVNAWNLYSRGANTRNTFEGDVSAGTLHVTIHTPASSSEACAAGQIANDASFQYVCTATNTWKRVALSSF